MLYELSLPLAIQDRTSTFNEREADLAARGHVGTHLDRRLGGEIPLERFKSRGLVIDVSAACAQREIGLGDLAEIPVAAGDFVILKSGYEARYGYGSREYMDAGFELSWEAMDWLIGRGVHFIGVDARGLRKGAEHRQADDRCEQGGVYVIENLCNLERLPPSTAFGVTPFRAYTAWFDQGGTGIPCRVVAELEPTTKD